MNNEKRHIHIIAFLLTISTLAAVANNKQNRFVNQEKHCEKIEIKADTDSTINKKINLDSLMQVANKAMLHGQNNDALLIFEKAYTVYLEKDDKYKQNQTLLAIGEIYYNWAKYDKALYYFLKAYAGSKFNLHKDIELTSLNYIGKYYHSVGDFNKSIAYYEKGYKLAQNIRDTLGIIAIQNKIGKHYETIGNYALSLEYYIESEKLLHCIDDAVEKATTYNHLGNTYHLLKEYDKALLFHHKALEQRTVINYQEGIAKSLNNIAEVLIDVNQNDSAMLCLNKSMEICQQLGYTKGLLKSYQNEGIVLVNRKQLDAALHKFHTALKLSEQISYDLGILNSNYSLAETYKSLGNNKLAILHAKKGLQLAQQQNVRENLRNFNLLLSELYEQSGQVNKALTHFKEFHRAQNEIVSLETNKKIAELETQFEVNLQRRANESLKQENQIKALSIKRKNSALLFVFVILILLVALIIIGISRYQHKYKAHHELSLLNEKIVIQNQELDQLNKELHKSIKQQMKLFSIISHELRNPLWWFRNLIQMLSQKLEVLDKDMIRKSLDSMYESANQTFHLMDNLLQWSKSQLGRTKIKIEPFDMNQLLLEAIAMIKQFAQYKQLTIEYSQKNETYVMADKNMIQTVIRNLISNAVKYTNEKGKINILLTTTDAVTVSIKDNGPGLDEKTMARVKNSLGTLDNSIPHESGTGLGLILSNEFISLNGSELFIYSEAHKGTEFTFSLPLFLHKNKMHYKKAEIMV
jgi:signal transduction histidine kinase